MTASRRLAPALIVLAGIAAVGGAEAASPGGRGLILAGAGASIVAIVELTSRVLTLRRWPEAPEGRGRISPARLLAGAAALSAAALVFALSGLALVATAAVRGWPILALGAAAVVVVLTAAAAVPSSASGDLARAREGREPWPRARRPERGTTPSRPGRPARRPPSS